MKKTFWTVSLQIIVGSFEYESKAENHYEFWESDNYRSKFVAFALFCIMSITCINFDITNSNKSSWLTWIGRAPSEFFSNVFQYQ